MIRYQIRTYENEVLLVRETKLEPYDIGFLDLLREDAKKIGVDVLHFTYVVGIGIGLFSSGTRDAGKEELSVGVPFLPLDLVFQTPQ